MQSSKTPPPMASSLHFLLLTSLIFLISPSIAQTSFRPKALVLPVTKDASTLQYLTHINQRTPLVSVPLTLDLGGRLFWVDCEHGYNSSSYTLVRCRTPQCPKYSGCGNCPSPRPAGCIDQCGLGLDNSITRTGTYGDFGQDVVSVKSTDGSNPGQAVSVPKFGFPCGRTFLLEGLASGVKGMAGLGRTKIGMPSRFAEAFSFKRKFAICLSSSTRANGVLFFGDGPYNFLPNVDASKSLIYTPLILNPVSTAVGYTLGEPSDEYFIGVKGIKISGKTVSLNTTLLSIDSEGYGGTKISTVNPYTVLETSIYKAVTQTFIKELASIPRVASVAPFGVCYNAKSFGSTRVGPGVPSIDLVLPNNVVWMIYGSNSMVYVKNDAVLCLGFVDGGLNPRTSIVIGGHQLEDNLLQFDLAASRLGFSSSLSFKRTTCSNFNFTSNA